MSGSILEAMSFRKKPKQEIKRIEISQYGTPVYQFTHRFSLDEYREYNMTVSQHSIEVDKKLKKYGAIIMGVISAVFLVLAVLNFDLPEYLAKGRTFWQWINYTGFMLYFVVFLMAGYLCYHLATFYKKFPKRIAKATKDYYETTPYLTHDITLAVYETGVLEKAIVRDEFFPWESFNRCWDSENVVYLEFTLANQLFVAKHTLTENGVDVKEFMDFCNEHIIEAKRIAAEKEAAEQEEEEAEEQEFEENKKKIAELEQQAEEEEQKGEE